MHLAHFTATSYINQLFTYLQPPLGKSSVFCVTVSPVTRSAGILACTQLKMLPVNGASHSANLHHRLAQLGQTSPAQSTAKGMSCLTTDLSCICKNLLPQPLQKDFIDKQHSITLLQFSVASVNLVIMVSKHCGQSFTSGGRLPNTQQWQQAINTLCLNKPDPLYFKQEHSESANLRQCQNLKQKWSGI